MHRNSDGELALLEGTHVSQGHIQARGYLTAAEGRRKNSPCEVNDRSSLPGPAVHVLWRYGKYALVPICDNNFVPEACDQ